MPKAEPSVVSVPLTLREVDMAICGLKIWRQVIVAEGFAQFMGGNEALGDTLVDIDETIQKLDQAKGK